MTDQVLGSDRSEDRVLSPLSFIASIINIRSFLKMRKGSSRGSLTYVISIYLCLSKWMDSNLKFANLSCNNF